MLTAPEICSCSRSTVRLGVRALTSARAAMLGRRVKSTCAVITRRGQRPQLDRRRDRRRRLRGLDEGHDGQGRGPERLDALATAGGVSTWWCLDLAIWHHVPSRVQGQSGFEAAVNPCRHWTGDGKTGQADCANGWTALFIKVRGALLDKLGLEEDDDMPLKLAQENPTLLKALVEAKSDAPPCLDAAGIRKVRAFVRQHAEGVVLALLPTQAADEPPGFDSPAARGNLSGYDMRLDDWNSAPGALENAARNPQASMRRIKTHAS